ncbi:MAG: hypothetical protein PHH77_05090 [Victivallaceae bacterium]|nr:hypothetical protein [Victivallaceae bacterium]
MGTICPYCNIEVDENEIELEDGCCPECGSVITVSSLYNDSDDAPAVFDEEEEDDEDVPAAFDDEDEDYYDDIDEFDDDDDIDNDLDEDDNY